MMLNNGRFNERRLLSRKTVELMTSQHVEFPQTELDRAGFGLGFAVLGRPGGFRELGSGGTYSWGGFFYTTFFIDPKEELIAISMAQLHPSEGVDWNDRFRTLVYQAIDD